MMEDSDQVNGSAGHFSEQHASSNESKDGETAECQWTEKIHHDGRQSIKRRILNDGGLPYSAEFYLNGEIWTLNGEDCSLRSGKGYIATVSLDSSIALQDASDFQEAKSVLLNQLKVENVSVDELLDEWKQTKGDLELILETFNGESGENILHRKDVIQLYCLLKKNGNQLNMQFKRDLMGCSNLSTETMKALDSYVTSTLKMMHRSDSLGLLNDCLLSSEFVKNAIQKTVTNRRARLASVCPSSLQYELKITPQQLLLNMTTNDMDLFNQLMTIGQAWFEPILPRLFVRTVRRMHNSELFELEPSANEIFLSLCKSLFEVDTLLKLRTGLRFIQFNFLDKWEMDRTRHPTDRCKTNICLRKQLRMLVHLVNHFQPHNSDRRTPFPYYLGMHEMPESVRIWLCLLDNCLKGQVKNANARMEMVMHFHQCYSNLELECLRNQTHTSILSFATT